MYMRTIAASESVGGGGSPPPEATTTVVCVDAPVPSQRMLGWASAVAACRRSPPRRRSQVWRVPRVPAVESTARARGSDIQ